MRIDEVRTDAMRPIVSGWVGKFEKSVESRKDWKSVADECMTFYSKSAAAMWDPLYTRKVWQGVQAPKFRISINKAFEMVAIFGPNLFWEVPHRTVESKKPLNIPQELFQQDPQSQQIYQQLMQRQTYEEAQDKVVSYLMQNWLNYTPREQPGGGLAGHSELAIIDSLIKGRGVTFTRPYKFPSSGRTLTGSFRETPENLLTDPDFKNMQDGKWISLRHVEPHWAVERRFKLEANSLKGKSSLESAWSYGESRGDADASMHRVAGQTNDMVVWYEGWSKTGPGARLTGMDTQIKEHLEKVVGDYAYLAIAPDVPYPLNCSSEFLRKATDDQVKEAFQWPVPLWADDRWPAEVLDYYPDPDSAWPIPPLAPALGELKFLNFLVPWLANRIWSSSRDFWAVAGPHYEHYKKYLMEGLDQTIIPTPVQVDDVSKAVKILTQPETRADAWRIVELVSEMFDKRVGLTEFAYGRNEGGTQNRTAEETMAKSRAVGVRPEHMAKKVVRWQSQIASLEAFMTRWFVTGDDVAPLMGPVGKYLWEQNIMSTDIERVCRQMEYTIDAASIRRPNRDRDIANFQQVLQYFATASQAVGEQTGNYEPYNFLKNKWAEFHDADLAGADIPSRQPDEGAQQLQQQQMQMEMQKLQAELQGKQMDMQGKALDLQARQAEMGMQLGAQKQKMLFDTEAAQNELATDAERAQQELGQDQAAHVLSLLHDRQKFQQDLTMQLEMGKAKIALAKAAAQAKPKSASNGSSSKSKPRKA